MRIEKCWFCSCNIYPGHGIRFVRSDCASFNFCRSKCFRLFKRRLNPRKIKWTKVHRKLANKELSEDPIYQFEKRNNEPVMFDKDLMVEVLNTVPKIIEERRRREDLFIANRILTKQEESKLRDIAFIEKHRRLLAQEETTEKKKTKEREAEYN